jgi:HAD superfamily hydrolase (TIGR01493 family)
MSNAGDLHVPYAYEAFPSLRFFTDDAISCYLHAAKPDRTFYEKALAKFDLQPETCLFIDDQHENVAGAQAVGIKAIQYTDPEKTIRRVRALL